MSTCLYGLTGRSPRALTCVSARGLEKLALNSGTTGGARKKAHPRPPPFHRRHNRQAEHLSLLRAGMSTISAMN